MKKAIFNYNKDYDEVWLLALLPSQWAQNRSHEEA